MWYAYQFAFRSGVFRFSVEESKQWRVVERWKEAFLTYILKFLAKTAESSIGKELDRAMSNLSVEMEESRMRKKTMSEQLERQKQVVAKNNENCEKERFTQRDAVDSKWELRKWVLRWGSKPTGRHGVSLFFRNKYWFWKDSLFFLIETCVEIVNLLLQLEVWLYYSQKPYPWKNSPDGLPRNLTEESNELRMR